MVTNDENDHKPNATLQHDPVSNKVLFDLYSNDLLRKTKQNMQFNIVSIKSNLKYLLLTHCFAIFAYLTYYEHCSLVLVLIINIFRGN